MYHPTITIASFVHLEKQILETIALKVQHEFRCQVVIKEVHLDLIEYFEASRRQYSGDKLLMAVDLMDFPASGKTIALFNVDLFIPILTYIFGQAQLGGRTAVASLYRLSNERYGMKPDDNLLIDRFQKVVIHELGHTFGLMHCHNSTCVMRSSTYMEDIDQKEAQLCAKCRKILDSI